MINKNLIEELAKKELAKTKVEVAAEVAEARRQKGLPPNFKPANPVGGPRRTPHEVWNKVVIDLKIAGCCRTCDFFKKVGVKPTREKICVKHARADGGALKVHRWQSCDGFQRDPAMEDYRAEKLAKYDKDNQSQKVAARDEDVPEHVEPLAEGVVSGDKLV